MVDIGRTMTETQRKRDISQITNGSHVDDIKKPRLTSQVVVENWKKCRQADLPARKSVLSQICHEMRRAKRHCSEAELERLKDAARQIELALYESAPTKEEYIDMSTLQIRIKKFLAISNQGQAQQIVKTKPVAPTPNQAQIANQIEEERRRGYDAQSTDVVVKIRRRRLLKLHHAYNCHDQNCNKEFCSRTKEIFEHVVHCEKESCNVDKCVSTRYLLVHFRVCSNSRCAVCSAVRDKDANAELERKKQVRLFSNEIVQSSLATLTKIVSKRDNKEPVKEEPKVKEEVEKVDALIDKRYVRKCVSNTGPNYLEHLPVEMIQFHLRSLKVEKLQPIVFPVLRKLMEHKHNRNVFNIPVDPVALNIPHYTNLVKTPMDLGTVRQKLEDGKYSEFEAFDTDVRLVFTNAMKFNPSQHPIHIIASRFLNSYESEIERMKPKLLTHLKYHSKLSRQPNAKAKCNLCFQQTCEICPLCERGCLAYEPRVIYCSSNCTARIQRNVYYYCTPAHAFCFCTDCVDKQKKKTFVEVQGGTKIKKTDLIKKKNNDLISEPWVSCDNCEKWCHQGCALYNPRKDDLSKLEKYVCPSCLVKNRLKDKEDNIPRKKLENKPLQAADLLQTHLSTFIEAWIRKKYQELQVKEKTTHVKGIVGDPGPSPSSLTVRLIHNFDEVCKLKTFAKKSLDKVPDKIKYSSKCLTLFQELDGVDTLIFVMFVQEYGDDLKANDEAKKAATTSTTKEEVVTEKVEATVVEYTNQANKRKIYIAYLDSIHYFRPRRFRTDIYHAIMLSYLEYSRRRGFYNAYIWACPPPNKRDDYILHCHPEDQRVPNPERLRRWYCMMSKKGIERGIVSSTSSMFAEHFIPKTEPDVPQKGRKSKKKAMAEIIAVNKSKKGSALSGKSGKELLLPQDEDQIIDTRPAGLFGGKKGMSVKEKNKWKENKLAFNQKMPYFDGDYWPQELEEIGKDEENKRKKKIKSEVGTKKKEGVPEEDLRPLASLSVTEVRTILFSRLADQLFAMKQDFMVVKLAYECCYCGEYLPRERYECRSEDCLNHGSGKNSWDKRSYFVLCEACVKQESAKPPEERHSGELSLLLNKKSTELVTTCGFDDSSQDVILGSTRRKVYFTGETHQLIRVVENVDENIKDRNPTLKNTFMETRHAFLALCAGNRYQFNQLRRAKASTLLVLYHLHNPKAPAHLYTCSKCQNDILSKYRYHCTKCAEFNLCEDCYNSTSHEHQLHAFVVTRSLKQANTSEAERQMADSRRARIQSVQIYLHFLAHAETCKLKKCELYFCVKIKSIIEHCKNCPKNNNVAACAPCKDLFILFKLRKQLAKPKSSDSDSKLTDQEKPKEYKFKLEQQIKKEIKEEINDD